MIVGDTSKRSKRAFCLHITITLVFVVLTLPVTLIFGLITYRANEQLIANHTDRFVQKTLSDHAGNTGKLLNPLVNSIRSASTLMRDNTDYFRGESSADYLQEIVISQPGIQSAYAAFEDGSLRQVRRAVKGETVRQKAIPAETQFINRFIHASQVAGMQAVDTYSFQAHWGVPIGEDSGPGPSAFNEQDFYKHAVAAKGIHISEPHSFNNGGDMGITIASPVLVGQVGPHSMASHAEVRRLSLACLPRLCWR